MQTHRESTNNITPDKIVKINHQGTEALPIDLDYSKHKRIYQKSKTIYQKTLLGFITMKIKIVEEKTSKRSRISWLAIHLQRR